MKAEAGYETRPIALVTILNSIRSKSQIKCAVHGVTLKLVIEESSGNTRSSSRDSDVVASDKRIGDTKHALIRAIQPDDGVIGHDAAINIDRATSLRRNPATRIAGIHAPACSDPGICSDSQPYT